MIFRRVWCVILFSSVRVIVMSRKSTLVERGVWSHVKPKERLFMNFLKASQVMWSVAGSVMHQMPKTSSM